MDKLIIEIDQHDMLVLVAEIIAGRVITGMIPTEWNGIKREAKKLASEKIAELMVSEITLA